RAADVPISGDGDLRFHLRRSLLRPGLNRGRVWTRSAIASRNVRSSRRINSPAGLEGDVGARGEDVDGPAVAVEPGIHDRLVVHPEGDFPGKRRAIIDL